MTEPKVGDLIKIVREGCHINRYLKDDIWKITYVYALGKNSDRYYIDATKDNLTAMITVNDEGSAEATLLNNDYPKLDSTYIGREFIYERNHGLHYIIGTVIKLTSIEGTSVKFNGTNDTWYLNNNSETKVLRLLPLHKTEEEYELLSTYGAVIVDMPSNPCTSVAKVVDDLSFQQPVILTKKKKKQIFTFTF